MSEIKSTTDLKTEGNNLFKNKKYDEAILKYVEALTEVENDVDKSILHSNISATYCKLEKYGQALEHAAISTKLNSEWYKAWYRLSFVLYKLEKIDQAKKAINKTLELCENNKESIEFIIDLKKDINRFGKDGDDTEDEEDINPTIHLSDDNSNNMMNGFPNGSMPDLKNMMPMMDNILKNDKIKSKLDSKDFQEKVMKNQNNPFAMLNDPDMRDIMSEMMKSMGKHN